MSDAFDDISVLREMLADEKAAPNDPRSVHALESAIAVMDRAEKIAVFIAELKTRKPSPVGYGYNKHNEIVPIYADTKEGRSNG